LRCSQFRTMAVYLQPRRAPIQDKRRLPSPLSTSHHRGTVRVPDLDPVPRRPRPVRRARPLRHDAFEAELAGLPEDQGAVFVGVLASARCRAAACPRAFSAASCGRPAAVREMQRERHASSRGPRQARPAAYRRGSGCRAGRSRLNAAKPFFQLPIPPLRRELPECCGIGAAHFTGSSWVCL
jgi:hypothetical protein